MISFSGDLNNFSIPILKNSIANAKTQQEGMIVIIVNNEITWFRNNFFLCFNFRFVIALICLKTSADIVTSKAIVIQINISTSFVFGEPIGRCHITQTSDKNTTIVNSVRYFIYIRCLVVFNAILILQGLPTLYSSIFITMSKRDITFD